ncbi:hypothetical protein F5Y17DRAFT_443029 [Xylariaceae sp. FL0594]|nr:hypothetical protein F5Y17DRAFT_443029 [Xylariaceae sp. FL0594]
MATLLPNYPTFWLSFWACVVVAARDYSSLSAFHQFVGPFPTRSVADDFSDVKYCCTLTHFLDQVKVLVCRKGSGRSSEAHRHTCITLL